MQGRYGVDALSRFLLFLGVVWIILMTLLSGAMTVTYVLQFLSFGFIALSYFRIFSRNIQKRYAENQAFLARTAGIRGWWKNRKTRRIDRKTHHIFKCPKCKQKIRVPKGKGKIEIKCPKCGTKFIKKS